MCNRHYYDVAIIGGGLAGLSAAILLQRAGYAVAVIEKEKYPFHKVCGEYISLESWNFLERLGVPLSELGLPIIKQFRLTAPNGAVFKTTLPLGGFGISRYTLDQQLAVLALKAGVTVLENTKVNEVQGQDPFQLFCFGKEGNFTVEAAVCLAAFGKRSNMDVKLQRHFLNSTNRGLENYVGIKYHLQTTWPDDLIALHNFKDGYCGISKIEQGKTCLCYLTTAHNLKKAGNSIEVLQQKVLMQNPHLSAIFKEAQVLGSFPITISQVSFATKTRVENGMLMLGDAAGMIAPLCGNGMSIALQTGKIAAGVVGLFLQKKLSRQQMEESYDKEWRQHFAARLQRGRWLQQFFGAEWLSNRFVGLFNAFPFLAKPVIRSTHGKTF
jgi:flavin-dependent dehydrogenase